MASGRTSSVELTEAYLRRIERLNPTLHAVIETNPDALSIARRRDDERQANRSRGPLHGIPVLVKDNVATNDSMETTAGSLALVGSRVPRDARIVARLRTAGAIILGKANLSEWANFRGVPPTGLAEQGLYLNGWSARGGFTRNPYDLGIDPCGSSSGSAVAVAANLCPIAIGTETDGSIVCPSGTNAVVGLKPTVGLVAQDGIIPISHSQDTAGPMGRTVADVAVALNILRTPFGQVAGHRLPRDYRRALRAGALRGARIGVDRRAFDSSGQPDAALNDVAQRAFDLMRSLGATMIDPIDPLDPREFEEDEMTVLLTEFRTDLASYLGSLRSTTMRNAVRPDRIQRRDLRDQNCGSSARSSSTSRTRRRDSMTRHTSRQGAAAWSGPGPTGSTGSSPSIAWTPSSLPRMATHRARPCPAIRTCPFRPA